MQIIPAILATTKEEYLEFLDKLDNSGLSKDSWVHIDFMDGEFVSSKSVGTDIILDYKNWIRIRDYKVEVHLMERSPSVSQFESSGVERILIHFEIGLKTKEGEVNDLEFLKEYKPQTKGGLVINPETSVEQARPYLELVDVLQIMGVHPGKQGQEFIPETLEKVKEAVRIREQMGLEFKIGVDGGVSLNNVKLIKEAGADYVVVGSHVFEGDINKNVQEFNQEIN